MTSAGHNENTVRLAALAGDAQIALDKVAAGEADANEAWVAYGAVLNEGRALFPSDEQFGQWVAQTVSDNLSVTPNDHERAAAMWAAANRDQYEAVCAENPNVRTVRGAHKKHLEAEAKREKERQEAERKAKAEEERRAREAAVEAAKADAEAKAVAEEKARKAAAAAKDEAERKDAEARAAEAAEVAKAAKEQAEAAEKAARAEAESDPYAEERKALAKFTRQGLEDTLIETRIALAEWKKKHAKIREERDKLKDEINAMIGEGDRAETIRRQSKTIKRLESERWRANEEARKSIAAKRRAEDRVKELEKMGIEI